MACLATAFLTLRLAGRQDPAPPQTATLEQVGRQVGIDLVARLQSNFAEAAQQAPLTAKGQDWGTQLKDANQADVRDAFAPVNQRLQVLIGQDGYQGEDRWDRATAQQAAAEIAQGLQSVLDDVR